MNLGFFWNSFIFSLTSGASRLLRPLQSPILFYVYKTVCPEELYKALSAVVRVFQRVWDIET